MFCVRFVFVVLLVVVVAGAANVSLCFGMRSPGSPPGGRHHPTGMGSGGQRFGGGDVVQRARDRGEGSSGIGVEG